jgi:hypothetical protein
VGKTVLRIRVSADLDPVPPFHFYDIPMLLFTLTFHFMLIRILIKVM